MQPTVIVAVHGACAELESWDRVIGPLLSADHLVIAAAYPLRGLAADPRAVSDLVRTVKEPVVLVARSHGGAVIANADEIVGLVYVNGFAPDAGEGAFQLSRMFPARTLGETLQRVPRSGGTTNLRSAMSASTRSSALTSRRRSSPGWPHAAAGAAGGACRAVRREPLVVADRRAGPHDSRRPAALRGPARLGPPHDRTSGCVACDRRLAPWHRGAPDPRGHGAASARLTHHSRAGRCPEAVRGEHAGAPAARRVSGRCAWPCESLPGRPVPSWRPKTRRVG
jgi:hypothetical protein